VLFTQTNYDAVRGADALLVITEWPPYRRPDFRLKSLLRQLVGFDGRNVFDPAKMGAHDFEYWSVGRTPAGRTGVANAARPFPLCSL
jgi:UDPglucose 6-dehydrogenase